MPTKKELIDELNFLSDVLSDRTRWIAGWVLGLSWLVIIQGAEAPRFLALDEIIPPIVLALLALLLDFSQYGFGYILNLRMLNSFPKETDSLPYDTSILLYRLRLLAFYAKIGAALVATIWLIVLLANGLVEMLRRSGDVAGS